MNIKKTIKALRDLEAVAYGYHINEKVLGMDVNDFEQIMVDTVNLLEQQQIEIENLKRINQNVRKRRRS